MRRPSVSLREPLSEHLSAALGVCLAAIVAYPMFWFVHSRVLGETDPLLPRLLIVAYAATVFVGILWSDTLQRHLDRLLLGLIYLITVHFFYLLAINHLSAYYVIGFLIIFGAINGGFFLGIHSRLSLGLYLGTVLAGAAASIAFAPAYAFDPVFYAMAIVTSVCLSFLSVGSQLDTRSRLRETETRLETLIGQVPVVAWTLDQEGRIVSLSGRTDTILGVGREEAVGRPITELFEESSRLDTALSESRDGHRTATPLQRGGRLFETWHAPLVDPDGEIRRIVGVAADVSERQRLEDRLRHAQKMEAVGRFAGSVAHDFNNILSAIMGHAQMVRSRVDDPVAEASLDEIRDAGERASSLSQQLLEFGRREEFEVQPVDLNGVVEGMIGMLEPLLPEDVELDWDPAPEIGETLADPSALGQVVMNLVVNARDAMPDGGVVRIATGRSAPNDRDRHGHRWRILSVTDTGTGIDDETMERLFEPFFTTKELGRGTGLGLAIVWSAVEALGGAIDVHSTLGVGTEFRIRLPAAPSSSECADSATCLAS